MHLIDSSICTSCGDEDETLELILFHCPELFPNRVKYSRHITLSPSELQNIKPKDAARAFSIRNWHLSLKFREISRINMRNCPYRNEKSIRFSSVSTENSTSILIKTIGFILVNPD